MSMSVNMLSGLNALMQINDNISTYQSQALSGKKINSAADGLAAYLNADGYSNRASRISNVNDTLSANLSTIKAGKSGLDSIRKVVTDSLDNLKAASQTQAFAAGTAAIDTISTATRDTQVGLKFQVFDSAGNSTSTAVNETTNLLQGTSTLRLNGKALAAGQIFTFKTASGTATNIRIGTNTEIAGGSGTAADAFIVKTVGDLFTAMRGNGSGLSISGTTQFGAGVNFANNAVRLSGSGAISITGTTNDVSSMFTGFVAPTAATAYTSDDITSPAATVSGITSMAFTAQTHTITGGADAKVADSRRAAAATSYKLAISQLNSYLKDASVSGINLLNGDTVKVTLNEKGESQNFAITKADGTTSQTFSSVGLGLTNSTGGIVDITASNFNVNDEGGNVGLTFAIDKLTAALTTLDLGVSQISQYDNLVTSRRDFNKSMVSMLKTASNDLTAADMTEVSANLASAQVQQSYAQTLMSSTKQSDQALMQLLR